MERGSESGVSDAGDLRTDATMSLEPGLRKRLEKVLSTLDDQGSLGPRLTGDAARLWQRVRKFISMNLISPEIDGDALELACYALQLPTRQARGVISGRLARTNLRDRCEQAAELLVNLMGPDVEEKLLDRTTRLLHEVPHRSPVIDEAKLMADALNLEDFGVIGLILQTVQLALAGGGGGRFGCGRGKTRGLWILGSPHQGWIPFRTCASDCGQTVGRQPQGREDAGR